MKKIEINPAVSIEDGDKVTFTQGGHHYDGTVVTKTNYYDVDQLYETVLAVELSNGSVEEISISQVVAHVRRD